MLGTGGARGQNLTVGPAYIAKVIRINGDGTRTQILNDERAESYEYGGLATFGFHAARLTATPPQYNGQPKFDVTNSWWVEGRRCASDDWDIGSNQATVSNVGVESAVVVSGPTTSGGILRFVMTVTFRDPYGTGLFTVRYMYKVTDSQVQLWTTATEGSPFSATTNTPFIKEPKFTFKLSGNDYTRMSVLDAAGAVTTNAVFTSTHARASCYWAGSSNGTGQCDTDTRNSARYDYGGYDTVEPHPSTGAGCPTLSTDTCLNIVGRTATGEEGAPGYATAAWEGSGYGLDAWERRNWVGGAGIRKFATADSDSGCATVSPCASQPWPCNLDKGAVSEEYNQRWEYGGSKAVPVGGNPGAYQFTRASIAFKGWDGGSGNYDCEPLAWNDSFPNHAWINYFSISFGPGSGQS